MHLRVNTRLSDDMTNLKCVEVVAAIISYENKIFAAQRGYGDWKDWWEFPGGKIEQGENHVQALSREIKEELSVDIKVDSFLTTVEYDYPSFHLIMHCYMCSIKDRDVTLLEHEAAKWLLPEELSTIKWLPADEEIIGLLSRQMSLSK